MKPNEKRTLRVMQRHMVNMARKELKAGQVEVAPGLLSIFHLAQAFNMTPADLEYMMPVEHWPSEDAPRSFRVVKERDFRAWYEKRCQGMAPEASRRRVLNSRPLTLAGAGGAR